MSDTIAASTPLHLKKFVLHRVEVFSVGQGQRRFYSAFGVALHNGRHKLFALGTLASEALYDHILDVDMPILDAALDEGQWTDIDKGSFTMLIAANKAMLRHLQSIDLAGWERMRLPNEWLILPVTKAEDDGPVMSTQITDTDDPDDPDTSRYASDDSDFASRLRKRRIEVVATEWPEDGRPRTQKKDVTGNFGTLRAGERAFARQGRFWAVRIEEASVHRQTHNPDQAYIVRTRWGALDRGESNSNQANFATRATAKEDMLDRIRVKVRDGWEEVT